MRQLSPRFRSPRAAGLRSRPGVGGAGKRGSDWADGHREGGGVIRDRRATGPITALVRDGPELVRQMELSKPAAGLGSSRMWFRSTCGCRAPDTRRSPCTRAPAPQHSTPRPGPLAGQLPLPIAVRSCRCLHGGCDHMSVSEEHAGRPVCGDCRRFGLSSEGETSRQVALSLGDAVDAPSVDAYE